MEIRSVACTCSLGMIQNYRKRISVRSWIVSTSTSRCRASDYEKPPARHPPNPLCGDSQPGRDGPRSSGGPVCRNAAHLQCRYGSAEISRVLRAPAEGQSLIRSAMRQMHLSARAYHRVLKSVRTIAYLADSGVIRRTIWPKRCNTHTRTGPVARRVFSMTTSASKLSLWQNCLCDR
jgi:magnesium chelatase family protein